MPYVQTSTPQIFRRSKKAVFAHVQDGVPVSQVCENLGINQINTTTVRNRLLQGRLTFFPEMLFDKNAVINMMIDEDVTYARLSKVYRVLKEAGMLQKKAEDNIESKGKGINSL